MLAQAVVQHAAGRAATAASRLLPLPTCPSPCPRLPLQNEVEAEMSGTIVKILAENGDAILPGQVRRRAQQNTAVVWADLAALLVFRLRLGLAAAAAAARAGDTRCRE